MNHSEAADALGSTESKSPSPKPESRFTAKKSNASPSIQYIGLPNRNSADEGVNSDDEEIVRKKSSLHPGSVVSYSLDKTDTKTFAEEVFSRYGSKSNKSISNSDYGAGTSSTTICNINDLGQLSLNQKNIHSQMVPSSSNRNYEFLASQTQVDNINRQNANARISTPENEKLRKMKQKKENKDKKKDKNVKVYTTVAESAGNGNETEFSIDKVLESLGEINRDKQQGKRTPKSKSITLKQSNGSSTEKQKGQQKTLENASQPEQACEKRADNERSNGKVNVNETEAASNVAVPKEQYKEEKDLKKGEKVKSVHKKHQVEDNGTISRNIALPESDCNVPGDVKKTSGKSGENSFTTVLPKKQKNKKKISGTDTDTNSSLASNVSSNKRSYVSSRSQQSSDIRARRPGTGQPNGSSNNRERGNVGNTGAKTSASTSSAAISDTNYSHQEVMRTSSSSAALVNGNNTDMSKYNYYQLQHNHQKSTGTSSITSDSVTGESISESASLATDLDLAADFPPLGLNENSTINNVGNGQNIGTGDEQQTLMGNRAPLPKAVWPIVRPNVSSSDSTAVIENIVNTTNVNENVNHASENHNSNNAVASPDVSMSSISTSSFTTASSNITISNVPSSQPEASNIPVDLSTNTVSVAQNNNAPSYSSALLGSNNSHKANSNIPNKNVKQPSAKLPMTPPQQQKEILIESNPPDITTQANNIAKTRAPLPDVTAQTSTKADCNENANVNPIVDSGTSIPQPTTAADICKDDSGYHDIVPISNEYEDGVTLATMQQMNTSYQNDSVSSLTENQSESQNSCFFVDDNKAVAIVLSEEAYNNNNSGNTGNNVMNMSITDVDDDSNTNVPAVTILGRGETPVADWSSRCDGLEFGGPINEDLLSMEYMKPFNMGSHDFNNYIQPHDSYYQEVMVVKPNNGNIAMDDSFKNEVNEHLIYEAQQCIASQNIPQQGNVPLPDMDKAIISFGECPEQNNGLVSSMNASSQITPHVFNADNNELTNSQDANDNKRNSESYRKYPNTYGMSAGLEYNSNIRFTGEGLAQDSSGNMMATQSIASASTNSSEENYPQSVPFNTELSDYSATNWANKMENEASADDEKHSESFLEANILYNPTAISEANKVNYNYQEILSFVSNSWEKVEKELVSGAKGKYYYSRSVPNKNNSNIAKLNNVQKH